MNSHICGIQRVMSYMHYNFFLKMEMKCLRRALSGEVKDLFKHISKICFICLLTISFLVISHVSDLHSVHFKIVPLVCYFQTTCHLSHLCIYCLGTLDFIAIHRYDLVDLTRQALSKYANQVFLKAIEGYKFNDVNQVSFYTQHFLDLVRDLDMLLACHEGFLLGPWLESAKNLAKGLEQEKQVLPLFVHFDPSEFASHPSSIIANLQLSHFAV